MSLYFSEFRHLRENGKVVGHLEQDSGESFSQPSHLRFCYDRLDMKHMMSVYK